MSKIDLYNSVVTELNNLSYDKIDGRVGRIAQVFLWRNNLEREKEEIAINFPSVGIEFLEVNYMESSSKAYQTYNGTLRLHILFKSFKTEDLDILKLTQQIYSTLQGKSYQTDNGFFGVLKRRTEIQDFDHPDVQDFIQDYDISQGKDYGADARNTTEATVSIITINPEIDRNLEA